jgi:hypothetical protein
VKIFPNGGKDRQQDVIYLCAWLINCELLWCVSLYRESNFCPIDVNVYVSLCRGRSTIVEHQRSGVPYDTGNLHQILFTN